MNYDNWKTHNPDDDRCEYCGAHPRDFFGWQPTQCSGECRQSFRDPDFEYEQMRDEPETGSMEDWP